MSALSNTPTGRAQTAIRDPALTARVIHRTPLVYGAGADPALDRPAHVRAASSVALIGGRLAIIQDDANFIAVVHRDDGRVDAITLPADVGGQRQFDDGRGNKHLKLDLEASITVVENGSTLLLAFGSGSSPARERIAIVSGWESGSMVVDVLAVPRLYAALRAATAFAGSELNLEGAALMGDVLWLFGRGNGALRGDVRPVNATCVIDWAHLREHLRSPASTQPPPIEHIAHYDLGAIGDTALGFTDATTIGEDFLYSAAAEASPDALRDGPVAGSSLGVIAQGGAVRWAALVDAHGDVFAGKVEGIALSSGRANELIAVVDHDDPLVPSDICTVLLEGPWFGASASHR